MAGKIVFSIFWMYSFSVTSMAQVLWVFESSASLSTQPNKKILDDEVLKKLLKIKEIDLVYIDVDKVKPGRDMVTSLGSSSVPIVYYINNEGVILPLCNLLTYELVEHLIVAEERKAEGKAKGSVREK